jgi:RNA polymerase sigma factor (TIGR02999 family)
VGLASDDLTALLGDWGRGDRGALDRLLPLVYAELRGIASRRLRRERDAHTLQPTALVHEVYLRLAEQRRVNWHSRTHFFSVASTLMRRILVDHARRRAADKRGNGKPPLQIEAIAGIATAREVSVLSLDDALCHLEQVDPGLARIVELRVFGGLTIDELAQVLKVSPTTAKRQWRTARAWLTRELGWDNPAA